MSTVLFITVLVAALALSEVVWTLVRWASQRRVEELKRRLHQFGEPAVARVGLVRAHRMAKARWLDELLEAMPGAHAIDRLAEQADARSSVAQVLAWAIALAACGALAPILGGVPWLALATAPLCAMVPFALLAGARSQRAIKLSRQLPDALDMMARALRAGHALPSAFKLVASEAPQPLAVEFGKAYEQQHLGLPVEQVVVEMAERNPGNSDLRIFAVGVLIQRETGGNLIEMLENIARTVRARFVFFSKLRVLTAEGRISGWVLGALPFVLALVLLVVNRGYLDALGEGIGRAILVGALALWCVGVLWLRALMRVEY